MSSAAVVVSCPIMVIIIISLLNITTFVKFTFVLIYVHNNLLTQKAIPSVCGKINSNIYILQSDRISRTINLVFGCLCAVCVFGFVCCVAEVVA